MRFCRTHTPTHAEAALTLDEISRADNAIVPMTYDLTRPQRKTASPPGWPFLFLSLNTEFKDHRDRKNERRLAFTDPVSQQRSCSIRICPHQLRQFLLEVTTRGPQHK